MLYRHRRNSEAAAAFIHPNQTPGIQVRMVAHSGVPLVFNQFVGVYSHDLPRIEHETRHRPEALAALRPTVAIPSEHVGLSHLA